MLSERCMRNGLPTKGLRVAPRYVTAGWAVNAIWLILSIFLAGINGIGLAHAKPVKILNDDGVNDAVQGNVKPGDKVVTEGQLRVASGQAVRIAAGRSKQGGGTP